MRRKPSVGKKLTKTFYDVIKLVIPFFVWTVLLLVVYLASYSLVRAVWPLIAYCYSLVRAVCMPACAPSCSIQHAALFLYHPTARSVAWVIQKSAAC